jgi:hypothetical protein
MSTAHIKIRCSDCGGAVKQECMERHKRSKKCRLKVAALTYKGATRVAHAAEVAKKRGLERVTHPDLFPKTHLRIVSHRVTRGRVQVFYGHFAPAWQQPVADLVLSAFGTLYSLVVHPVDTKKRPRIARLVIEKCTRAPALRAELEAVHLLGGIPALAALILNRVPGVWGALQRKL